MPSVREIGSYIWNRAPAYGVDPGLALGIARGEGLNPNTIGSASFGNRDARGYSFGPYQLYSGSPDPNNIAPGGMAYQFQQRYGSPPNASNWQQQVDFSLERMRDRGTGDWYAVRDRGGVANITAQGNQFARQQGFGTPDPNAATAPAGGLATGGNGIGFNAPGSGVQPAPGVAANGAYVQDPMTGQFQQAGTVSNPYGSLSPTGNNAGAAVNGAPTALPSGSTPAASSPDVSQVQDVNNALGGAGDPTLPRAVIINSQNIAAAADRDTEKATKSLSENTDKATKSLDKNTTQVTTKAQSLADQTKNLFVRGAFIVLGLIFVYIGLTMFRNNTTNLSAVLKRAAK